MKTQGKKAPAPASTSTSTRSLLETAAAKGTFITFAKAVEAAGLSEALAGPGPFTVFAPTDEAFARLPEGKLDMLLKPENRAELIAILNYHVMTGRKTAAEIGRWDAARTVNGLPARIRVVGKQVSIDEARVTTADMDARNGYLHAIDKVNLPAPGAVAL